jgi:hypothetical protein
MLHHMNFAAPRKRDFNKMYTNAVPPHVILNTGGAAVGFAGHDEVGCTACGGDQKSYASGSQSTWGGCTVLFLVLSIILGAVMLPKECCTSADYCPPGYMTCSTVFSLVATPPIAMVVSILALCKCCCFGVPRRQAMAMGVPQLGGPGMGAPPVQIGVAASVAAPAAPKFDPNTGQPIAAPCSSCGTPSTGAAFCANCGAKA